jgi:hypothetical protein
LDDSRGTFSPINKLGNSVTDYRLPSQSIIHNILEFQTGEKIIGAHMLLLLELQNIIDDTNNNNNKKKKKKKKKKNTYPTQLQK